MTPLPWRWGHVNQDALPLRFSAPQVLLAPQWAASARSHFPLYAAWHCVTDNI